MPSGWTTSGIDWTNVRNNRTSDVVYHLAQATAELYSKAYRETISGSSTSIPPNYTSIDFRIRQETCYLYICNTLKRLFSEDESFFDNSGRPLGTRCFISDNENPNITPSWNLVGGASSIRYNDYAMGINILDIAEGGELELNCGDLSFLRDSFFGRIDYVNLQTIYNILTYPKKCILTPFVKEAENQYLFTTPRLSFFISRFYTAFGMDAGKGEDPNINTAINRMYNGADGDFTNQIDIFLLNSFFLQDNQSNSIANNTTYDMYSGNSLRNAIDDGEININNLRLDIIKWSVSREEFGIQKFGIYPDDSPYGVNTSRVNNIDLIPNNETFLGDVYFWDTKSDLITSGLPTLDTGVGFDRREDIYETGLVLSKLDIEGVMDYYTE